MNNIDSKLIDYTFEYQSAHQLYMSGDYNLSLDKFKFLLDNKISNDLADNCQFWIAQIYFVQNDYLSAVDEFSKVLDYKNSNKSVDSFYKIGLCFIKLNDNQKAINAFQEIIRGYVKWYFKKYFRRHFKR